MGKRLLAALGSAAKGTAKWVFGTLAFLLMLVGLLMVHPFELVLAGVPVFLLGLFMMIKIVFW